jgi:hypothetical protein
VNDTAEPGCFWHGVEPLTADDYRVCLRCGHAFRTREELINTVHRCRAQAADAHPHPTAAHHEHEPQSCPLCAYDW